jgi:hypothetical protein
MSLLSTKLAPPATSARLLTPKTPTIPLLSTHAARIYSHAHAPLVLAYYLLRFSSLVADPLNAMIRDLAPIAIAQCALCTVCLPSAGTWGSGGSAIIPGTASGKSGKTGSGPGTGSMRRKAGKGGPGTLSTAFPAGAASWKSKVMVGKSGPRLNCTHLWETLTCSTTAHCPLAYPHYRPTSATTHPRRPHTWRPSLPPIIDPTHNSAQRPHLTSRHPSTVLHTRHLWLRLARHYGRMVAIRRSGGLGRIRWLYGGWVDRCSANGPGLGSTLAGLACYGTHWCVSGMGLWKGAHCRSEAGHW